MTDISDTTKNLPPAFFIADSASGLDLPAVAQKLTPGTGIIFRDYKIPDRDVMAGTLAHIAKKRGLVLLIAGDPDLACSVGAHGLHLPQWQLQNPPVPPKRQRKWIMTAAAHDRHALRQAHRSGIDAVLVSPVFATPSHPDAIPLGVKGLRRLCRLSRLPVYALGGITGRTLDHLPNDIAGIAALSAFADKAFRRKLAHYQKLKRVPR